MKATQSPRDEVLDAVVEAFGVPREQVESPTRGSPRAAAARAAAMALLRARGWTLERIGGAFGRDRASVHAALERAGRTAGDGRLLRARELLGGLEGPCARCGCTEQDCRGCIERTGAPCHWILPELCSACFVAGPGGMVSAAPRAIGDTAPPAVPPR